MAGTVAAQEGDDNTPSCPTGRGVKKEIHHVHVQFRVNADFASIISVTCVMLNKIVLISSNCSYTIAMVKSLATSIKLDYCECLFQNCLARAVTKAPH